MIGLFVKHAWRRSEVKAASCHHDGYVQLRHRGKQFQTVCTVCGRFVERSVLQIHGGQSA